MKVRRGFPPWRTVAASAALLLLAASGAARGAGSPPASAAALELVDVSPSVVMAQHDSGANSTCIALDDGLVFIDAGMSTGTAARFRSVMEARFGRPTQALVLTHAHVDHVLGLGAFRDVRIIAAEVDRPAYERLAATEWTEQRIAALSAIFPTFREAIGEAQLVMPSEYFADHAELGPPERRLAITRSGGHTTGSSSAYLAADGVIVAGDLVQSHRRPYFGEPDTDLSAWIASLKKWHGIGVGKVCPGHGPVVDGDYLPGIWSYFEALTAVVARLKSQGLSVAEIAAHPSLPNGYWGQGGSVPRWWGACVARVYESL